MDGTQQHPGEARLSKATLVTLIALISMLAALMVGIYASRVGDLTFYEASGAGGGAFVIAFTLGMIILGYLRE
ncbi:hypothetical protein [Streptomyces caniscabiei]|uniref:Integral membrane protein n=1 Tax=Streptomyces caniscabiei TaxID=2746961 RepID=A0ABU4N4P3_9ACTN|nr:hypothetical protein [Streptomyces caniscabiei]MBE4740472.1 hypothetical protein [Streptomyces caniscabiei]MBE4761283.1 hypothetical protein [Streptomyces caniscabiei]MBE4773434.1 hypothetical protein [Streptomyces caniscabiei]MBE4790119.1 hypothetical protein [Streptomyces caniscabiei]MBE4799293.1 hypothetical protein [Streptomyces caniscabiei]